MTYLKKILCIIITLGKLLKIGTVIHDEVNPKAINCLLAVSDSTESDEIALLDDTSVWMGLLKELRLFLKTLKDG